MMHSSLFSCPLFSGISSEDLSGMLDCLGARRMSALKGQTILREGGSASEVGILLSGHVQLILADYYGNRTIIQSVMPGQLFAESFACSRAEFLPVDVYAASDCEFLLIDCRRIMSSCSHACSFHRQIIFNLLQIVADSNLSMHQRALITAKRTTREKLMAYLLTKAKEAGCAEFSIPFDRQSLADYLTVDRSGLSAELSKLRKEGILEFSKNHFCLLDVPTNT